MCLSPVRFPGSLGSHTVPHLDVRRFRGRNKRRGVGRSGVRARARSYRQEPATIFRGNVAYFFRSWIYKYAPFPWNSCPHQPAFLSSSLSTLLSYSYILHLAQAPFFACLTSLLHSLSLPVQFLKFLPHQSRCFTQSPSLPSWPLRSLPTVSSLRSRAPMA